MMIKMRKIISIILLIFLIQGCTTEPDKPFTTDVPVFTDALTLELSFGDENVPDEYLLAWPMGLAINNGGDIYVADEERLKVFDENGTPKTIVGGKGEGPGEFRQLFEIAITPTDYITAGIGDAYNFFTPNDKFIRKYFPLRNITGKKLINYFGFVSASSGGMPYLISETEYILTAGGSKQLPDNSKVSYTLLVHEKDDSVSVLAEYKTVPRVNVKGRHTLIRFSGRFHWRFVSDNSVVFIHSAYDRKEKDNNSYYILHVVSLYSCEKSEIYVPYEKIKIAESVIEKHSYPGLSASDPLSKIVQDKIKELKYYPPIMNIFTDNKYIFAFLYRNDYSSGYIANVIDVNSCKHISTVRLPFIPLQIKNGYAYMIKSGPDIFPVVEKYKINPSVWKVAATRRVAATGFILRITISSLFPLSREATTMWRDVLLA